MEIEIRNLPMAGREFQFAITGGIGRTFIEVYVDTYLVFQHDCDDPPCHEISLIPQGTRGSDLLIIARDSAGNEQQFVYTIGDSDSGASGMMSMEG